MNKNRLLSILSEVRSLDMDVSIAADLIMKQINEDIWHNPDGTERYLTPEQYEDLRNEKWVGLVWFRFHVANKHDPWQSGVFSIGLKIGSDYDILCAGNHGAPPDDYRHDITQCG